MTLKFLTIVLLIASLFSVALGQASYSESTPFTPTPPAKPEKQKKAKKTKDAAVVSQVAVSANETVEIPISVLDSVGGSVNGLKKSDITVFVDGTETPITAFEKPAVSPNIIFLLDMSPSAIERFEVMRKQALALVGMAPSASKFMVIEFDSEFVIRSRLNGDRAQTQRTIGKVGMGSGTAVYDAIRTLFQTVIPDISGRSVVVLITDGVDTDSRKEGYLGSLAFAEKSSISIYPIYHETQEAMDNSLAGWGRTVDRRGSTNREYETGRSYLKDLATATGGRMFTSQSFDKETPSFIQELSGKYYATISVPKNGAARRQLRIRINRPNLTILARGSYIER